MKYWVYINNKVDGPYDENSLVTVAGFTPDTLVCSEEVASSGGQEWVKASSLFEFDEEPAPQTEPAVNATPAGDAVDTQELLARIDTLSSSMSDLQAKVASMQTHLDQVLQENKKLAQQIAPQSSFDPFSPQEDSRTDTITLTRTPSTSSLSSAQDPNAYPEQAAPKEEELIIRSALDSIYGGKEPVQAKKEVKQEDESFHDLITGETSADLSRAEEEEVENIATHLHFTPVAEEEQPVVENAVITTPSAFEAEKDALINELTSSAKEDVLDQIIAEHQQEQPQKTDGASVAAAGAVAGLAAAAAAVAATSEKKKEEPAFSIATDKENPTHLEDVLPANEMPEDVLPPAIGEEPQAASTVQLPSAEQEPDTNLSLQEEQPAQAPDLPVADLPEDLPKPAEEKPAQQAPDLPVADMPDELPKPAEEKPAEQAPDLPVADAPDELPKPAEEKTAQQAPDLPVADAPEELPQPEPAQTEAEKSSFPSLDEQEEKQEQLPPQPVAEETMEDLLPPAKEETTEQEPAQPAEEPPAQPAGITEKDLQDAFGDGKEDPQPEPLAQMDQANAMPLNNEESAPAAAGNPNDLTEIELKEGSTYLISDFVPPAQVTDDIAEVMKAQEKGPKRDSSVFQDMLAASTIAQSARPLSTDGLPDDLSATQINLENTIQAKRGPSMDIKTVPVVPDPAKTDRLDMNDLNDVNSQHDIKTQGLAKSTKMVMKGLIALLVLIVLYVVLGMLHLLPGSINMFAGKQAQQPAVEQNAQDLLQEQEPAVEEPAVPTAQEVAQEKVQNFPLPNGLSLKGFIEAKHPTIAPQLITWEVADAVEPDNYSVTVKVPPENPQSFKTVYRFNYNMQTGMLDPTISDAKNLLDQAYGVNKAQSAAAAATSTKTTRQRKTTTRRNRKR